MAGEDEAGSRKVSFKSIRAKFEGMKIGARGPTDVTNVPNVSFPCRARLLTLVLYDYLISFKVFLSA